MSYSITISGHSPNPHNDDVVKIAVEAVRKLKALEGTVSLTGYTYDSSAVNRLLDDNLVAEFKALDVPEVLSAQSPEFSTSLNAATFPPAEVQASELEPAAEVTAEPEVTSPAPADSTGSASTTPDDGA